MRKKDEDKKRKKFADRVYGNDFGNMLKATGEAFVADDLPRQNFQAVLERLAETASDLKVSNLSPEKRDELFCGALINELGQHNKRVCDKVLAASR